MVVPLPKTLTFKEAMAFGTAGFTAALCCYKLEQAGVTPESGQLLVTGASGGVGSLAVALLSHRGYSVAAASGKSEAVAFLKALGAAEILPREEVLDKSSKPLLRQRWAGVVDTVGGDILSTVLRSAVRHGVVTCCGNAASADLHITVYPFILRGVSLLGADSATSTMATRRIIWQRLSDQWKISHLDRISSVIGLEDVDGRIDTILSGRQMGRYVIKIS